MARYYPREYYNLSSSEQLDTAASSEQFKIQMLLDQTTVGRLVEIGSGEGAFALAARRAGFDVTTIEMDRRACEHLRAEVGVSAIESATPEAVLPTLPPSRAVVLWHVIEHLPNPVEVIAQAARNLEGGGVLAIATPNPRSLQFRLLGRRWAHLDAPRHQFLIPPRTLANHCSASGLFLASSTTSDPAGRYWNTFGWEYALRRTPRTQRDPHAATTLARSIARAMAPIETRGENGCAYTSIFGKPRRNDF
jgi:SAM-dependent methyltransferase